MAYTVTPNEAREAAFDNRRLVIARLSDADAFGGGENAKRCYLQAVAAFDMAKAWEEYADEHKDANKKPSTKEAAHDE